MMVTIKKIDKILKNKKLSSMQLGSEPGSPDYYIVRHSYHWDSGIGYTGSLVTVPLWHRSGGHIAYIPIDTDRFIDWNFLGLNSV